MPWARSRSSLRAAAVAPRRSAVASAVVAVGRGVAQGQRSSYDEREQALLGAVVEVALDAAARRVAGLDDPRTRRAQVLELGEHLGAEPLVVDRERAAAPISRSRSCAPGAPRRGSRARGLAVADDRRRRPPRRSAARPAGPRVDVPLRDRQPIGDFEALVAE